MDGRVPIGSQVGSHTFPQFGGTVKPHGELFRGRAASSSGSASQGRQGRGNSAMAMAGSVSWSSLHTRHSHSHSSSESSLLRIYAYNLAYPFDQSLVSHSNFRIPAPNKLTCSTVQASSSQTGCGLSSSSLNHIIITPSHLLIASFHGR